MTKQTVTGTRIDFIPASESKLFIPFFGWFCKQLARLHFHKVWIRQEYHPAPDSRTLYFLNHSSWWDGLVPLLLNRYRFHQKPRAMMEDRQMIQYRFFKKLGAFSVSLNDPAHALRSLRYAVRSMDRPSASLYIYPEGEMTPFSNKKPDFRKGITWICRQLSSDIDIVPIGIYGHTLRHSRPEMHIHVGKPVHMPEEDRTTNRMNDIELLRHLETELQTLLSDLTSHAGFDDDRYEKWI
jgi:1-acyl-sn-glycerol-3-phosphate acyltransferase